MVLHLNVYIILFFGWYVGLSFSTANYPVCRMAKSYLQSKEISQRIVAVGDIHGEYHGLLQVLSAAGLLDLALNYYH